MNDQELAAIEARQKAATPSGRVIFESDIIEKDVPKLIQAIRETQSREGNVVRALQNMVGLFGEAVTKHVMGKAYTDLHSESVKIAKEALAGYRMCVHCGTYDCGSAVCTRCLGDH